MTSIEVNIAGINRGAYVLQADIWRESLTGVGRWEVILDPRGVLAMPGLFVVDAQVVISINGVIMMRGYIDDILPYHRFHDQSTFDAGLPVGRHVGQWKLVGRDRGMDLAQHYVTANYVGTAADAIVGNAAGSLLALIPSELTRVTVGPAPGNIDYEAERTFIGDAVRDIAQLVNYDFYVDDAVFAGNANLRFFDIATMGAGAEHTAADLILFAGATPVAGQYPILDIDVGESVGFGVKNYVEAHAGSLMDHWTDLNAADWIGLPAAPPGVTVTDDLASFLNGKGAIRVTNNTAAAAVIGTRLGFPRYSYAALNLSEPTRGNYNYFIHDTSGVAVKRLRIRLTDTGNRQIEFYRSNTLGLAKCKNCTDQPTTDEWRKVDFPLGNESGILPGIAAQQEGMWYEFDFGSPPAFDWYNVRDIEFWTTGHPGMNIGDYFIVDGLQFPNVEVISISQDAASIGAYGRRMREFYRPDIKNQVELNAFSARRLAELKDPKETIINVVSIGSTLNRYAGQSLDIVAPQFGIGGPLIADTVRYRILRLHHKVVKKSEDSEYSGYTFYTEFELIKKQVGDPSVDQHIYQTQVLATGRPDWSLSQKVREEQRYRRRTAPAGLYP